MNLWSRLGLSVAIAALWCIIVMEAFQQKSYYQEFKWVAWGTFFGLGLVSTLVGWRLITKARKVAATGDTESTPGANLGSHLTFWGPILLVLGAIVFCLPYKEPEVEARMVETPPPPPKPEPPKPEPVIPVPEPEEAPAPIVAKKIPDFRIQGLVYRPPRSSVIIDKFTYFVGDSIGDVEIVSIEQGSVTFKLGDERKTIPVWQGP